MNSTFLLVPHITCAAVWFGGSISLASRIRRGLSLGDAEAKLTVNEVSRTLNFSAIFGVLTLVTGLFLIFHHGGFKGVPPSVHQSLGLVTIMLVFEFLVMRLSWKSIRQIVEGNGDRALIKPFRVRLTIASGIQQLLWLVVLWLMVADRLLYS